MNLTWTIGHDEAVVLSGRTRLVVGYRAVRCLSLKGSAEAGDKRLHGLFAVRELYRRSERTSTRARANCFAPFLPSRLSPEFPLCRWLCGGIGTSVDAFAVTYVVVLCDWEGNRGCDIAPARSRRLSSISADRLIMAALCNKAGHYIFALWFLSFFFYLSFFFPRLISAVAE